MMLFRLLKSQEDLILMMMIKANKMPMLVMLDHDAARKELDMCIESDRSINIAIGSTGRVVTICPWNDVRGSTCG